MTEVKFRSDVTVELIDSMASDMRVIHSAQVSTKGSRAEQTEMDDRGQMRFIDFLMDGRHGSPFEHCVFTFLVEAPIFVWREFMRHRIASYNEESGRYKKLEPVFYIPDHERNLVQEGKPGEYVFVSGTPQQYMDVHDELWIAAREDYARYERLLDKGIAREVARMSLPVNIYSSAYVTINARSLMNFLSLRVKREHSMFPSFPQREIEMVAEQIERVFMVEMPLTYEAFEVRGRVAP